MTFYMGHTESGGKTHLIDIHTEYETEALCGARVIDFVTNYKTTIPVVFAAHWQGSHSICLHCKGKYNRD